MGQAQSLMHFGELDQALIASACAAAPDLGDPQGAHVHIDARIAPLVKEFIDVLVEAGAVAFGPLNTELSPEQAGKILGVSRPLVVQRMEDGRLPFHYVGTHRRCKLTDVLTLKDREAEQNANMAQIYDDLMDVDHAPAP